MTHPRKKRIANDTLYDTLLSLGFSIKDIRVYLALLELGRGTVSKIARMAGINRTTAYDILDNLVQKGLATELSEGKKQSYLAESPDKLEVIAKEQLRQHELAVDEIKNVIPELKSIHTKGDRPVVRFYEGVEGLKHVWEETLTAGETIRALASVEVTNKGIPDYFPKYYKRRAAKGIKIKAIFPHGEEACERSKMDKIELRESVHVPSDRYWFAPEINIYDNKVMIASWNEKLGITIESQEIADTLKQVYDLAWEEAKRLDNKIEKK